MSIDRKLLNKIQNLLQNYCSHSEGKFPKIEWIQKWTGLKQYKVVEALRILEAERFLDRNYNQYTLNPIPEQSQKILDQSTKIPRRFEKNQSDILLITIRIVMAVIGMGASWLSMHYTRVWLLEFLPSSLATLLSTIMILFSVASFEALLIFWANRKMLPIVIFSIVWIVVLIFSMISTVAGQYNSRISNREEITTERTEVAHARMALETYEIEESELMESLTEKRIELRASQTLYAQFDTLEKRKEDWRFYWNTKKAMDDSTLKIESLQIRLGEIREKKRRLLKQNLQSAGIIEETEKLVYASFYVWLGEVLKAKPMMVQFWLSIFPALFIDIIAPLALAVSLFLNKWKKEED